MLKLQDPGFRRLLMFTIIKLQDQIDYIKSVFSKNREEKDAKLNLRYRIIISCSLS